MPWNTKQKARQTAAALLETLALKQSVLPFWQPFLTRMLARPPRSAQKS